MGWEWHFSLWASLKFYLFNQRNFLKHNVALQGHSFVLQFQMTLRRVVLIPRYGVYRLLRYPIQVVILSNILWTIALFLVSDLFSYIPFFIIKWPLCASLQISLFAVWIFLTWFIFLSDVFIWTSRWLGWIVLYHLRVPWNMFGETHGRIKLCGKPISKKKITKD